MYSFLVRKGWVFQTAELNIHRKGHQTVPQNAI
jgi:hypothetical protein